MFYNGFNNFKLFVLNNFPFIEKDFDAMTDYQVLCKIFEYFENQIKVIRDKYENFDEVVENLENEFAQLKADINTTLINFKNEINNDVNIKLQDNYNQIIQLLSEYQTVFNNNLATLRSDLEAEIERVELGDVKAYNPTTRRN